MSFEVGQLVLCKVPSYPKWPGVIVPESEIPSEVLKARKGKTHCVFFFGNDPSFFWGDSKSLFPLSVPECDKLSKKSKGVIKKAFAHALQHQDDFLEVLKERDGDVDGVDEVEADDGDADDVEADEDVEKDDEEEPEEEVVEEEAEAEEEYEEEKEVKPKKGRAKAPAKRKAKTVKAEPAAKRKAAAPPPPAHLSWTDEEKYKHFWYIRTKLQKGLISRPDPPTVEEMQLQSNVLTKLETLDADNVVDLNVLKTIKLHKVLKALLKLEKLERPNDFKFHERSKKLLASWAPIINEIKSDKGRDSTPLETSVTPLSSKPDLAIKEESKENIPTNTLTNEKAKA